jgi:MYXO-CTERM domain-containing protein
MLLPTPFKSSRTRALATPTLGARETELDIDGDRIHVYTWGDPATQPYVLFAHGWSSHGTRITPWVAPLQEAGYAVVAFDQAGHGRSSGNHTNLPDFTCHLLAVAHHFGPAAAVVGQGDSPRCEVIVSSTETPGAQDYSEPLRDLDVCAPAPPDCGSEGWLVKKDSPRPGVACGAQTTPNPNDMIPKLGRSCGCGGCSTDGGAPVSVLGAWLVLGAFVLRRRRA